MIGGRYSSRLEFAMRARAFLLKFIAVLLCATANAAHAATVERPMVLVASAKLGDTGYRETVLIALPLGDGQHMGFILNRRTDASLAALFPDHPSSRNKSEFVYAGGPMLSDTLFAVVQTDTSPAPNSLSVLPHVFLVADAAGVARVIEHEPTDARYFAGFVGWKEGELDAQIGQGLWSVLDASADVVFRKDPTGLWKELSRRVGPAIQESGNGDWV
jgi:putative transcriptional regulator